MEKRKVPPNTTEDLESIIDTLKKFSTKVKAIKIKKVEKKEKRNGLLDSGATQREGNKERKEISRFGRNRRGSHI